MLDGDPIRVLGCQASLRQEVCGLSDKFGASVTLVHILQITPSLPHYFILIVATRFRRLHIPDQALLLQGVDFRLLRWTARIISGLREWRVR